MDSDIDTVNVTFESSENQPLNIPLTVFRLIVCVAGIFGNLLVIFVILVLAEYKKAVTHWYVLQLAIADSIFLLSIPFRVVEDIEKGWIFPIWMCKAKETILFLNYYSSVSFLVVMSVDRYIAVCHGFSSKLQKLRTPLAAGIITLVIWIVCLLMCIPVMMYSTTRGHLPHCRCEYDFPKPFNATATCLHEGEEEGSLAFDLCVKQLSDHPQESCIDLSKVQFGSGSGYDGVSLNLDGELDFEYFWGTEETTASPEIEDASVIPPVLLQPGCHYFDFAEGFKAFIIFNFVVMFILPLIVMSICYALIINRLHKTRFRIDSGVSRNDSTSESKHRSASTSSANKKRTKSTSSTRNRNRIRVTIMCAAMVTLFFICWLPYHSVHLARFVGIQQSSNFCFNLFSAVSLLVFLNSAINPYLYNFIGTRFMRRLSSAASTVRESVKKRTSSLSGAVHYHYRKRPNENGGSNSHTGTVTTKIYKGKHDVTNADVFSDDVFSNDSKHAEEQQRLTSGPTTSSDKETPSPPQSPDIPPSYDNYKEEINLASTSRV